MNRTVSRRIGGHGRVVREVFRPRFRDRESTPGGVSETACKRGNAKIVSGGADAKHTRNGPKANPATRLCSQLGIDSEVLPPCTEIGYVQVDQQ